MKINPEAEMIRNKYNELISQPFISFLSINKINLPDKKGVYLIRNKNKKVLHVGQTPRARHGIKQRIINHLHGQSSFVASYFNGDGNQLRKQNCLFQFLIIDSPSKTDSRTRALLESYAIGCLCPKHIGSGQNKNS